MVKIMTYNADLDDEGGDDGDGDDDLGDGDDDLRLCVASHPMPPPHCHQCTPYILASS